MVRGCKNEIEIEEGGDFMVIVALVFCYEMQIFDLWDNFRDRGYSGA